MRSRVSGAVGVVFLAGLIGLGGRAADAPADEPVVVVDSAGKEIKLTKVRFTTGTRRLSWLPDKSALALEVREPNSTQYAKGITTLVPLASVESIAYEPGKATIGVKGLSAPLVGTTEYKGFSAIGFEGDSGGVVGKFAGGVPKSGIKSVTFPGAKPLPERKPGGTAWSVTIDQPKAGNPALAVRDLKVLYASGAAEQVADALPVRKGEPLKFDASLKRLEVLAVDPNTHIAAAEVQPADSPERTVAIPLTRDQGGKTGVLVGLLGEVDAGWKLFPLHTIKVLAPAAEKQ
jgi:hypothetical protein